MAFIKKTKDKKCGKDTLCGEKGNLGYCWWQYKLVQPLWQTIWRFLKKFEIELTCYWSSNPTSGYMKRKVTQSCPTLCDPMAHPVNGILQARILEWVGSLTLLQGIFSIQGSNPGLLHCRQILYQLSNKGNPRILEYIAYPLSQLDLPNPVI